MRGRLAYPPVDARRGKDLREAFLRDIAALAPEWRGAAEEMGHDRALVEIAARLLEHTTRRLDKTPERDALAFLDMLDVPAPQPRSAEGYAVLALAPDRAESETVAKGAGLDLPTDAGAVRFETDDALTVHPARIDFVATVSPATDEIGLAPPEVTSLEPSGGGAVPYVLDASIGPSDAVVRLSFTTGLEPGNLLRFEHETSGAVRIRTIEEVGEDGLVKLTAPIGEDGLRAGEETISRMTWVDAFEMPDQQEHALYLGDQPALEVSDPADITLHISGRDPEGEQSAADAFAETPYVVEIFGTRETDGDDAKPGWHRLPLVGRSGNAFTYLKAREGPVLETEIAPDMKSRWLRIRRLGPILPLTGSGEPDRALRVDKIELQVESEKPDPSALVSSGVTQAAHNATPLPVTSSFLPFGAEPQRFDVFALAAPESFSKVGATATLSFTLLDATLMAMGASVGNEAERHVFGVASNGRLQFIDRGAAQQYWIEIEGPEGGTEPGSPAALLTSFGVRAAEHTFGGKRADLVVAAAQLESGASLQSMRLADDPTVLAGGGQSAPDPWRRLPDLPDGADPAAVTAFAAVPLNGPPNIETFLFFANERGVFWLGILESGVAASESWELIDTGEAQVPNFGEAVRIAPVQGSYVGTDGDLLVADQADELWLLRVANGAFKWIALSDGDGPLTVAPGAMPVARTWTDVQAALSPRMLSVAYATGTGSVRHVLYDNPDGSQPNTPVTRTLTLTGTTTDAARVTVLLIAGIDRTNTTIGGWEDKPSVIVIENPENQARIHEWQIDEETAGFSQTLPTTLSLARPDVAAAGFSAAGKPAELILAGATEQLLGLRFNPTVRAGFRSWVQAAVPDGELDDLALEYTRDGESTPTVRPLTNSQTAGEIFGVTGTTDRIFTTPAGDRTDPAGRLSLWTWNDATSGFFVDSGDIAEPRILFADTLSPSPAPAPGSRIFVARAGDDPNYAAFTVDTVEADDDGNPDPPNFLRIRVTDPLALAAHMQSTGAAIFRTTDAGDLRIEVGQNEPANHGTFVFITGTSTRPASLIPPGEINARVPFRAVEIPFMVGNIAAGIVSAWGGAVPADGWIKINQTESQLQVFTAEPLDRSYQGPELSWEYFNGSGWKRLGIGDSDTTRNLARSGSLSFKVPADLSAVTIGGQEDLWVRARLVGGDYGRPRYEVVTDDPPGPMSTQTVTVQTGHMRPPEVAVVSAHFADMPPKAPEQVIARNNLRDINQTSANALDAASYPVFQGAHLAPIGTSGNAPAIFLGLTQALAPGLATLFVRADDRDGASRIEIQTLGADLAWAEAPLTGADETGQLRQSGLLRFSVTTELAKATLFGQERYWLRILGQGADWLPRIRGMWLNGVPIVQAETVTQELLGTSLGEKDTRFQLLKSPVLESGLELRVRERLSDEEVQAMRATRAEGAPDPVIDNVPDIPGQWVLWEQVQSFEGLGPARAYLLTPEGTVTFGSGDKGRIPPAGRDGVRAFGYRVGGIPVGAPALTPLKPLAPPPGFETAFTPDAVAGGSEFPDAPTRLARMPAALRHQNAALTLSDLEAIARNADTDIVQIRAQAGESPGDPVRVHVLAKGPTRTPNYSKARRAALAQVLTDRMSDAFGPECLRVEPADDVPLKVRVAVRAVHGDGGRLNAAAHAILHRFFDPVLGGPEGAGWPLGRTVWPLDVDRALRGAPGLSAITEIVLQRADGTPLGAIGSTEVVLTERPEDILVEIAEEERP